jgi:hypothetical protein
MKALKKIKNTPFPLDKERARMVSLIKNSFCKRLQNPGKAARERAKN